MLVTTDTGLICARTKNNVHAVLTFKTAASEGVSNVAGQTCADRIVVDDATLRIEATHSGTGVNAVLVDTGHGGDTVRVDNTLWSAPRVGVSKVLRSAGADTLVTTDPGISIGSTWVGVAWVSWWWWC